MENLDLVITAIVFVGISVVTLLWMLINLLRVVRGEGLSNDASQRIRQTKEVLLLPMVIFFGTGALLGAYLMMRGGGAD